MIPSSVFFSLSVTVAGVAAQDVHGEAGRGGIVLRDQTREADISRTAVDPQRRVGGVVDFGFGERERAVGGHDLDARADIREIDEMIEV